MWRPIPWIQNKKLCIIIYLKKNAYLEKNYIKRLINTYENAINSFKKENNRLSLNEYDEFKEQAKQKNKIEQIISDKDLIN